MNGSPSTNVAKGGAIAIGVTALVGLAIAMLYVGALWMVGVLVMVALGAITAMAMRHR